MLVLLTHSFIDDFGKTVSWIVKAADMPVSVVIIGVGRVADA